MAEIIDGKALAAKIRGELKEEAAALTDEGRTPGLAVILVGDDPASKTYVRNKAKACAEIGIYSERYELGADTAEEDVLYLIKMLAGRDEINGILVQSPLPPQIDGRRLVEAIPPEKDVDAFHPANIGRIMRGDYDMLPCTPAGVMELIKTTGVEVEGSNCVVVGRSDIVGKPMAMLLLQANGTVTMCHNRTRDLPDITRHADILVVAVGRPKFITGDMIKPGAVVIDVGMDRDEDGKLCGDVDFASAEPVAGYITPVPGGVGPMTVAMLMKNTVNAAKRVDKPV